MKVTERVVGIKTKEDERRVEEGATVFRNMLIQAYHLKQEMLKGGKSNV